MRSDILLVLFPFFFTSTAQRGPHHPHGEVVRHHVHYRPTKQNPEKITQDVELLHDKEHLQEHLDDLMIETDLTKLSNDELDFYYFHLHDTDKNKKLDGLEIFQAIMHTEHNDDENSEQEKGDDGSEKTGPGVIPLKDNRRLDDFTYLVELIDQVLREDDTDQDGLISYPEYVAGRKNNFINKQPKVTMV